MPTAQHAKYAKESVICPWCEVSFDVVPASTAKGFTCAKCGNESSLGALRNPDLRPEALNISREAAQASTLNLHRHTVAFVFINEDGNEDFASGTYVQIRDRHFLATVAHADPENIGSIVLVGKGGLVTTERLTCVTRRIASANRAVDVAVFEMTADVARRVSLEPIGIDRINDSGTGTPNLKARLIGYPVAYKIPNHRNSGIAEFYGLCYGCEPIEPERWGAIPPNTVGLDRHIHAVVDFSYDVVNWNVKQLPVPDGMPDPFGLSGGGLWQRTIPIKDDELWKPDDLWLFGIQSSWLRQAGFLIAIQIIHWLKLVADEYSELRSDLQDRFPRLKQL